MIIPFWQSQKAVIVLSLSLSFSLRSALTVSFVSSFFLTVARVGSPFRLKLRSGSPRNRSNIAIKFGDKKPYFVTDISSLFWVILLSAWIIVCVWLNQRYALRLVDWIKLNTPNYFSRFSSSVEFRCLVPLFLTSEKIKSLLSKVDLSRIEKGDLFTT